MRVLWVCNIMLPVIAEHLHLEASNKEGWLSGLADVILRRQKENEIVLGVAFPMEGAVYREEIRIPEKGTITAYGFREEVSNAERYDSALEEEMRGILEDFRPDVIHCFGTEYGHTLATVNACARPERVLVSIQGVCSACAQAYMADLPLPVQNGATFRDRVRKDSIRQQQEKFAVRGKREQEVLKKVSHIAGRTELDACYASLWNPDAAYFHLNETLRSVFYEGQWPTADYEPYTIFMSQGDYPIKGLHYMLRALPLVRKSYPEVRLVVAGNSLVSCRTLKDKIKLSGYGKYLRRLLKQYDLKSAVRFAGRLTGEEMKEQYLRSGVYVCCSTMENSPNSLGEAMILGVPCVAADVGGIPSIFTDREDGILFKGFRKDSIERDAEGAVAGRLAEAVMEIFGNEEKKKYYCGNARRHAQATHDREKNYRRLLEIYGFLAGKEA